VLNGTKAFISGGGYSDGYIVMARTGADGPKGISALVVMDGAQGLSFGGLEDKMGWRSQPTRQVQFDDCRVGADALLGEEGAGFRYAMAGLDGGRLNIAACSLGGAQAALDATLAYMAERRAFGQSIDQFQALQFRLADMEIDLQAARVFLRQAAWKLDRVHPMRPNSAPWPRNSSQKQAAALPTNACNCMAAMGIWPITALKNWCAICGYTRFWKARMKSCA
jgi:alkylation response protein AidB-like acyl-CoA dehydrogenase